MNKILKKILYLTFLIIITVTNSDVHAQDLIDTDRSGILNIYHSYCDEPLSDVEVSIYHIADITEDAKFIIDDTYKDYPIDYKKLYDSTEWYVLADTLASYIKADNINATNTLLTNYEGNATLYDLSVGLYLGIAKRTWIGNNTIETKPFLISIPTLDENTDTWEYDITVKTKTEENTDEYVNLFVEKKWVNTELDENTPDKVTVGLYKDGELYDTVILSDDNNWKHNWINLDKNSEWTVIEIDVPPHYNVYYEVYRSNITIVNSYKHLEMGEDDDTDEDSNEDSDGTSGENDKDDIETGHGDKEETDGKEDTDDKLFGNLPYTGALIGSAGILVVAIILIITGYLFVKEKK